MLIPEGPLSCRGPAHQSRAESGTLLVPAGTCLQLSTPTLKSPCTSGPTHVGKWDTAYRILIGAILRPPRRAGNDRQFHDLSLLCSLPFLPIVLLVTVLYLVISQPAIYLCLDISLCYSASSRPSFARLPPSLIPRSTDQPPDLPHHHLLPPCPPSQRTSMSPSTHA